ncbi:MAG: T9SS type B sorting domain-containing protein [Marinilabiliaceae bacterium]|nr:T9SS type B sorting domain-containing protein [Marinilabiliaceae bacterium]
MFTHWIPKSLKFFLLSGLFLFILNIRGYSQVGTEFWFVAPNVSSGNGDTPISFRITALDKAAEVSISLPANGTFSPIRLSLAAYTQKMYEIKDQSLFENQSVNNSISNNGVLITSTENITVYYEVANENNPDKFTLKGLNALGLVFFIPSQNQFFNHSGHSPKAYEKADIVATQDNSIVTITPSVDVNGHVANIPYQVSLNKGQTYSLIYTNQEAAASLAGTQVVSNKEIAITISDDSVMENRSIANDLIGDQLIPVSVIGKEYIAIRTNNFRQAVNNLYIMATEDDTYVYMNGNPKLPTKLNKGEFRNFPIHDYAMYVKADKPVYAYQVTSIDNKKNGNETGSAVLPHIECTGSDKVSFARIFNQKFFIQILIKGAHRDHFTLSGPEGKVELPHLNWKSVTGTFEGESDEAWYAVSVKMDDLATNVIYSLENSTGLFHMSIMDEYGSSVSFGYFSSYQSVRAVGASQACIGDVVLLTTLEEMENYEWFSEYSNGESIADVRSIEVTQPGVYWVNTNLSIGGCKQTDSIEVQYNWPEFQLPSDTVLCAGEEVTISLPAGLGQYLWYDYTTDTSMTVTAEVGVTHEVWVEVTNEARCSYRDTMLISTLVKPDFDLPDLSGGICQGDTIRNNSNLTHYEWRFNGEMLSPGDTLDYIVANQSGDYSLTGWNEVGCSDTVSLMVSVNPLPMLELNDVETCYGEAVTFIATEGMASYLWSNQVETRSATYSDPGEVVLKVTNMNGCSSTDSASLSWLNESIIPKKVIKACQNTKQTLIVDSSIISNFNWYFDDGSALTDLSIVGKYYTIDHMELSHQGFYIVAGDDINGCSIKDSIALEVVTVPLVELGEDQVICADDSVKLAVDHEAIINFQWSSSTDAGLSNTNEFWVNNTAIYFFTGEVINGCLVHDTIEVTVNPLPTVSLNDKVSCKNTSVTFHAGAFSTFRWFNGSTDESVTLNVPQEVWVEVTDANGCTDQDTANYTWYRETYVPAKDTGVCEGNAIALTVDPALTPNSWFFKKGTDPVIDLHFVGNTFNISGASAVNEGLYIISGDDIFGCTILDTVKLTVGTTPLMDLGPDRQICEGDTIRINGNHGFKEYQWTLASDPLHLVTDPYIIITKDETVHLTAIHSNGCTKSGSVNVSTIKAPEIDLGPDLIVCPETPGIDLYQNLQYNSHSGTEAIDQFIWDSGIFVGSGIDDHYVVNEARDYPVIVFNNNSGSNGKCFVHDTIKVVYHQVASIELDDVAVCSEDSTLIESPLTSPVIVDHYRWFKEAPIADLAGPVNQSWKVHEAGNYILFVTDKNDCEIRDTMRLVTKPLELVGVCPDKEFCEGDSVLLYGQLGAEAYQWSTSSQPGLSNLSEIWVKDGGDYVLTVWGKNGCSNSEQVHVQRNELPTVDLGNEIQVCSGSDFHLNVINFTSGNGLVNPYYLWSTGETASGISVRVPGKYQVWATDEKGCVGTDSILVSHYPSALISLGTDIEKCNFSSYQLEVPITTSVGISSYYWSKLENGKVVAGPVNLPWMITDSGNYMLTATDANQCVYSDTLQVIDHASPQFSLGADREMCEGDSLIIKAETGFTRYEWNDDPDNNQSSLKISASQQYKLKVWNEAGCVGVDEVYIEAHSIPSINLTDKEVCAGEWPLLEGPAGDYSYLWSNGDTTQSIVADRGSYTLKVEDRFGCVNSANANVIVKSIPNISIGVDTLICPLDQLMLDAGVGHLVYKWHNGLTNSRIVADWADTVNIVQVQGINGCWGWDSRVVKQLPLEDYELGDERSVCRPDTIMLDAGDGFLSYRWHDNSSLDQYLLVHETGDYSVEVSDGCFLFQDTMQVTFLDSPIIARLDTSMYGQVVLYATGGLSPYTYGLNGESQYENIFNDLDNGKYLLQVEDANGCSAEESIELSSVIDLDVSEAVTPNSDGINDRWEIRGLERFPDSKIFIYNRYGKLLIEYLASDPGWNGEYLGRPVPSDAYWYIIEVIPLNKSLKGHITLKR